MSWTPRATPFTASDTTAGLALSLSSTRAPVAGDLMDLGIGVRNSDTATIVSVVDDQGGTWTRLIRHAANGQFVEQWAGVAAVTGNTVITVTFSAAVQSQGYAQAIESSVGSWFKQDEASGSTSAGTTHTPGTVDAAAGDLLTTMTSIATAFTVGALATDYSQVGTMSRAIAQRRIAAGTISPDGAWTTTAGEDTVSTHVVLREGSAGLSTTSTAATASWVTPAATAETPGASTSTAASAAWTAPASAAAPGAVTRASTAASALWIALEGTSAPGAVTTPSTAAAATWATPGSTAAAGAITATATAATAAWAIPAATASTAGTATSTAPAATWTVPAAAAAPGAVAVASTAAAAPWGVPTSTATGVGSAASTAAAAAWATPPASAAPGAITATSTAPTASWVTPVSVADVAGAGATSTAAATSWAVPVSGAAPGAVGTTSAAARAAWVVPTSGTPAVPDVLILGAITIAEPIRLGTITQVGQP